MTSLEQIATDTPSLSAFDATEEDLALVELLHSVIGPRLAALGALDVTRLAAEPNLDPGRAPREP